MRWPLMPLHIAHSHVASAQVITVSSSHPVTNQPVMHQFPLPPEFVAEKRLGEPTARRPFALRYFNPPCHRRAACLVLLICGPGMSSLSQSYISTWPTLSMAKI